MTYLLEEFAYSHYSRILKTIEASLSRNTNEAQKKVEGGLQSTKTHR